MIETALFRVAQEAIANAHKHSGRTRLRIESNPGEGTHVIAEVPTTPPAPVVTGVRPR